MSGLTRNQLTSESKALLRKTVRGLRESLIEQLKESAEQRYLLSIPAAKVKLAAEPREYRRRLDAALDQAAEEEGGGKEARARAFELAARQAGATLLNRLVLIRHLEALGLSKPAVLTGGWMSSGYREFQSVAGALCADETQGMAPLLDLLFAELAVPLPGLFGEVGLSKLFPVSPATLRQVIEALDAVPADAWSDDLTLGWVYQFWNDPDREALDAKIAASGKIEPHELASKTQMFTERYMVEWLLQNSLGATWLALCKKKGWTAEAESTGTLARLDARRAEWRKKREAGEVAPEALMPIESPLEEAWKYYVPQPTPAAVVEHAPDSLQELKLLDPACGSGHFLVVAFDLLVELYREEGRHLGEQRSDRQIAERILEKNLHGIDIDPRAVQLAAAGLYLKARALSKDADPKQVNLVAPVLKLSALKEKDPGLVKLEEDIERETGIPPAVTREIIKTLAGVDHLGSLLRVGDAIDKALEAQRGAFSRQLSQAELFTSSESAAQSERRRGPPVEPLSKDVAKKIVLKRIEGFLSRHATGEDLGLRLRGQQLSAGLRFSGIAKEGEYDVVVGNPPYQGTSKMKDAKYIAKNYPKAKSDLYAAFLERGFELCRPGGASAMVTMRSWMFLSGFTALREHLLKTFDLRILGDVDRGAFEEVPDEVVATTMSVFRRFAPAKEPSIALQPTPLSDKSRDSARTSRKRAAVLAQAGLHEFRTRKVIGAAAGAPLLYWWSEEELSSYERSAKLAEVAPARFGMTTGDNARFVRLWHEVALDADGLDGVRANWRPFAMGGKGRRWIEPLRDVCRWRDNGLEIKASVVAQYGVVSKQVRNEDAYFKPGVVFSAIGDGLAGRKIRYPSIISNVASGLFPAEDAIPDVVCLLNSKSAQQIAKSFNPGLHIEVGDVNRLPVVTIENGPKILRCLEQAFEKHEAARESSIEFRRPGPSAWESVQAWAQEVVDSRQALLAEPPNGRGQVDSVRSRSFSVGVSLGRFDPTGSGVRLKALSGSLREGLLFLGPGNGLDMLLADEWLSLRKSFEGVSTSAVSEWLKREFWDFHRGEYENRPIYFPLSSSRRSFVAFVYIHRWTGDTLTHLLSDYLIPERKRLEGAIADLRSARASGEKKGRVESEQQLSQQQKWLEELEDFIAKVVQIAERGPPPPDDKTPKREADHPYVMELDDGVMVNAAALWPLLEPMWKDPKKWWKELATAKGRKDYDWSHLAKRYFPDRVDEKCKKDPSLGVAHGCFWKYHPEIAYQWELRLQDEIGPDFRIDEEDSEALRKKFLKEHKQRAAELETAERLRRERKANKKDQDELDLDAEDDSDAGDDEDASA